MSLEYNSLPNTQVRALLKSPSPLADVFAAWEDRETSYMRYSISTKERMRSLTVNEPMQTRAVPAMTGSDEMIRTFAIRHFRRYNETRSKDGGA